MEKQQERKPLPAHILKQVEQCGWSAHLAQEARESREDKNGTRDVRTEITRSWAVQDQAQLPDAYAAQMWLMSIGGGGAGTVRSVGESLGLVDADTGEELASEQVDTIVDTVDGEVLVASWVVGEHFAMPEPEGDLGLVAMGLAACNGKPFRVAHVYLQDGEAYPRRSPVFPPESHVALLDRVRKAASTPRNRKCPGTWCTHCRVAPYCTAWLARAQAASVAMTTDLVLSDEGEVADFAEFELTPENAAAFCERLELLGKVYDYAKDLRDGYVRRGGVVMLGGKQLVMSPRAGRVTVSASELRPVVERLRLLAKNPPLNSDDTATALTQLVASFEATVKTGNPYEVPTWKKPEGIGGRR